MTRPPRIKMLTPAALPHPNGLAEESRLWARCPSQPRSSSHEVEQRHAERDPISDLVKNQRVRAFRHLRSDLNAAINWPRVHDEHIGLGLGQTCEIEPMQLRI